MNKDLRTKILCLIVALFGYLFIAQKTNALPLGLSIDPPVSVIKIIPPATASSLLSIQNNGDKQVRLQIQLKPFKAKGENGEIEYFKEASSILKNVQVLYADVPVKEITLNPRQQKNLKLIINLPQDTNISDYYFSVIFISMNTSLVESTSAINRLGIATNILLSIGSQETPTASLEQFSSKIIFEKSPIYFTVKIKNNGKHLIKPKGEIVIKNIFGQETEKTNLLKVNILYDSTRTIPQALRKNNFILGLYTANLNVSMFDNGPINTRTIYFLVLPLKVLALIIIAVIIIAVTIRKIKLYANKA